MKRLSLIMMSVALVLGMAHCKKNDTSVAGMSEKTVSIMLDVDRDSKVVVTPGTGVVNFQTGDKIYAAINGVYVGTLTHNGTNFSGNITTSVADDTYNIYFYFMGNKTPSGSLKTGTTTSLTVNIMDQTESYPVISAAPSNEKYSSSTYTYTATLLNKCGLVKFTADNSFNTEVITITGVYNKMTVSLGENTFTPGMADASGAVQLASGSTDRWAILLPQASCDTVRAYCGAYTSTITVDEVQNNSYLSTGIALNLAEGTPADGVKSVSSIFTINSNLGGSGVVNKVNFSQGNLQYQADDGEGNAVWRFAENQYDIVGSANTAISSTNTGWIDLFGWGTSGWESGAVCYQPYSTSTTNTDYYPGANYENSLTGLCANADWGVYNAISNGGNEAGLWRIPLIGEFTYMLNNRLTASGIRYAKAIVNDVNGLILFPDYWHSSYYTFNSTNVGTANFSTNVITLEEWADIEAYGAVFLPVAGTRNGTTYNSGTFYWTASMSNSTNAYTIGFSNSESPRTVTAHRNVGRSVRLIRNLVQ